MDEFEEHKLGFQVGCSYLEKGKNFSPGKEKDVDDVGKSIAALWFFLFFLVFFFFFLAPVFSEGKFQGIFSLFSRAPWAPPLSWTWPPSLQVCLFAHAQAHTQSLSQHLLWSAAWSLSAVRKELLGGHLSWREGTTPSAAWGLEFYL